MDVPRYDLVVWCDECVHGRHDPEGCLGPDGRRIGGYDTLEQAKTAGRTERYKGMSLAWEYTVHDRDTGEVLRQQRRDVAGRGFLS